MVSINYIVANSNIIIKQNEIDRLCDIIEHHKFMVRNHYYCFFERQMQIENYINKVKQLKMEVSL